MTIQQLITALQQESSNSQAEVVFVDCTIGKKNKMELVGLETEVDEKGIPTKISINLE